MAESPTPRAGQSRSLREKLDEVKQLVNRSSSLRLRVDTRSSARRSPKDVRPSVMAVFSAADGSPSPPRVTLPASSGSERRLKEALAEVDRLQDENRRLREDFEEAINVIRRVTEARKADRVLQKPADMLLEELQREREESQRLRLKVNSLLAQVSEAIYLADTDEEENDDAAIKEDL